MDINTQIPSNCGHLLGQFGEQWKKQIEKLKEKFLESIEAVKMPGIDPVDVPVVYVKKSSIVDFLIYVRTDKDFSYDFLSDYTASDEGGPRRFDLIWNLYSLTNKCRIRIKTQLADGETFPTLIGVWPGANWAEREIFDMYGVKFDGHPDLRRILMDVRWVGHPLRKDYPLKGYQLFSTAEPIEPHLLED